MNTERNWARGTAEYCAALVLVVVGLPVIAFAGLLLRGILAYAAMAAVVAGIILFCVSPTCRRRLMEPAASSSGHHFTGKEGIPGRD